MNARMILGEKDTEAYLPHAGKIRGYEGLRTLEKGSVTIGVMNNTTYASQWVKMWCEDDIVYAAISFARTYEQHMNFMEKYEENRRLYPNADVIVVKPVFGQTPSIIFFDYTLLETLAEPTIDFSITICAHQSDVQRLVREKTYIEHDWRKTYLDARKQGDASWWYMHNIYDQGIPLLERIPATDKRQVLADNEYGEVAVSDDKIAREALQEMQEREDSDANYLDEAFNSLHIYKGSNDPYKELDQMEGLDDIKENVNTMIKKLRYYKNRKARGKINNESTNMHMCFMGSPGTGKTTLARIMVGILYEMGMIEHNEFVEIAATKLKAMYANQTAKKTELVIRSAYNRVLFIDEAYALASDDDKDYGREAINEILKQMEDNRDRLIIIFAGYQEDMQKFLDMNQGFRSRINRYYIFRDFSPFECTRMVLHKFEHAYSFTKEAIFSLYRYFLDLSLTAGFGNVRTVKLVCQKMIENWAVRTVGIEVSEDRKYVIEEEDISRINI